ncbi:Galactinol synthase 1 [Hibiscus syriacus]|uniref:Hexosyltransferase n=1 Tax=Hibiscus syriacus TaxID=106335 RepID=A0A6A2YAA6_HIBSY|nr:Galactinol synthase 1 [Hibiscus syriacus]
MADKAYVILGRRWRLRERRSSVSQGVEKGQISVSIGGRGIRQRRSLVRSAGRPFLRSDGLFCETTWRHTPQYEITYCQQCPDKIKWPDEKGQPPSLYFNAGMFVFEPGLETYENLLQTLEITPPTPFAEQDFLNMFFKDIYKPIPLDYNLILAMLWRHPENVELENVKVVHYCAAGSKPWRYTGKEENMQREDVK